jgi:hypothetical protein
MLQTVISDTKHGLNKTTRRVSFWVEIFVQSLCKTTHRGSFSVEIFMQSLLLKYKVTVKVLAIFIQRVNHEKFIKQLL